MLPNVPKVTVLTLQHKIVKGKFAMVAPDVQIEDGRGTILISSEEGETEANTYKKLSEFGIRNGSRLQADGFLQDHTSLINILHSEDLGKDLEFEVVGDTPEKVGPKPAEDAAKSITKGRDDGAPPSTSTAQERDDVLPLIQMKKVLQIVRTFGKKRGVAGGNQMRKRIAVQRGRAQNRQKSLMMGGSGLSSRASNGTSYCVRAPGQNQVVCYVLCSKGKS